jgi:hypothetical protein
MKNISLPANTGIVIQGPSLYADQISTFWHQFDVPIVFSTYKDEPAENVLKVERSGVHVELIEKPSFNGYLNINLQNKSSLHGLKYLESLGVKHALKIRSDSFIYGLERLWPLLIDKELSFAHIYNPQADKTWAYYLYNKVHLGMDWIVDYAAFGDIKTLLHLYDFQIGYHYPVPPESLYVHHWLAGKNLEHNFDINYLKNNGMFYFGCLFETTNSTLVCLKHDQDFRKLINLHPNLRLT